MPSSIRPELSPKNIALPQQLISVAVAAQVAGCFDYIVPPSIKLFVGSVVIVPFGNRRLPGIVMGLGQGDVATEKLRILDSVVNIPPLAPSLVQFIQRFADWTLSPLGAVAKMILSQRTALLPQPQQKRFFIDKFATNVCITTPARKRVLDVLSNGLRLTSADICMAANVSMAVIARMTINGQLGVERIAADVPPLAPKGDLPGVTLTTTQIKVAKKLAAAIGHGFVPILLDGVTGSGKTEVYFEAVKAAFEAGQQILILLPEIALSASWRQRFAERFGVPPVEWHSDVSKTQKRKFWRFVIDGKVSVVVGARSALFLPFKNLGLIIVDEEHEHAFKQEDQVIYQARDMAVLRAQVERCPIILASATPSLESWVNAGGANTVARYQHVILPNRALGASLPRITLIDLRKTPPERGSWLAPSLVSAITKRLDDGEQSLLFLNRRGFAPLTLCGVCGAKVICPNCDSWMVAHRLAACMRCHHCGYETLPSKDCTKCSASDSMRACGPGVERLAEEVLWRFPKSKFAVLSSDTVGTSKAAEVFIQSVHNGEVDIIIGTQMVAKGHHFPNLTLVGVIDADLGLAGGDLRASERTFQMLSQVAGRAGRESRPGEAMLQTIEPDNAVLASLLIGDRDEFLEREAAARLKAGMPPFDQLAAIILSSLSEDKLQEAMCQLRACSPKFTGVDCFGPVLAPLAFLKGRHRARFLVRANKNINLQMIMCNWIANVKLSRQVRLQIDIDPYSFL